MNQSLARLAIASVAVVLFPLSRQWDSATAQEAKGPPPPTAQVDSFGDPLPSGAVTRIGTTRLRAKESVNVVAFSPDGRRLAYGTEDGRIYLCDAADGKPLFDLHPNGGRYSPASELAFSPDGRTLAASGYWSQEVWLIDLATQKVRHALPNSAAGQDRWARQWQGPGFAFTPDGRTLVVGGKDGALHLWDTAKGTELASQAGAEGFVSSLTLTADGRLALTAHRGGELHLWDVTNRKHLRKLDAAAKHPHLTALAPDGKTVALAAGATELELWDPEGGLRHQIRATAPVVGLGFTADGASLLVADGDGNVLAGDVRTGKTRRLLTCEGISLKQVNERMGRKPSAWFRSDGKAMAWAASSIRPWDLTTGQETPRLTLYRRGLQWAGFSADGRLLRAFGAAGELGVWDSATGLPHVAPRNTGLTPSAHYTPALDRGKVIAVTGADRIHTNPQPGEGRIFLWDPTGDTAPVPLRGQAGPTWYAAMSPDNRFVVAPEATGHVRVYDAATGKLIRSFDGQKTEYRPTFSPDGTLLATTASDRTIQLVRLYDFATGRVLRDLKGQSHASCLAFAPDGRTLASGHMTLPPREGPPQPGDMIYLWDPASGRELRRIPTGHHNVETLSFSPDGRLIASGGFDRVVRLWEAASGQERRHFDGHQNWIRSVDFAPDGRRLASASLDGTALVWQVFDPGPAEIPAAGLETLWADLAKDGLTAHRAMASLIAAKGTAAFLGVRVKPAVKPSDERLRAWLADVGSPVFETREAAHQEIARVAEMIEPALQRALEAATDAEVRRRLTALVDGIPRPETRPEHLRTLRAVEVLEHLGNAEARRLLEELTEGAPEAHLTREAKTSLARRKRK